MKQSDLFDQVMSLIWENDAPSNKEAVAIVSYIKNHRVNAENAFEVLAIMWPDSTLIVRPPGQGVSENPAEVWYDLQFSDGSQVLLLSMRGIGCSIEVL